MIFAAIVAGAPVAAEAWGRLRARQFSIALLVVVAAAGALVIGEAWEAAAVTFLYVLGGLLENLTLTRTRAALRDLIDQRPLTAQLKVDDEVREVPVGDVSSGQTIVVKPGDRVPVDGRVAAGRAVLDTAAITGEPMPKETSTGDRVLSGSVSQGGYLEVVAERVGQDTTFNRLIYLMAQAQDQKPKVQRFLDRFAQWYTPAIVLGAVGILGFTGDVRLALTFLVIGCPGALLVAAPVAVVSGLGSGARQGILIKGGERLESIGRLDTVAFDKTGTLTRGEPRVAQVVAFRESEEEVLALAAGAEQRSEHHLARAILDYAENRRIQAHPVSDWSLHPGLGVEAVTSTGRILVGNRRFLDENEVEFDAQDGKMVRDLEAAGKTVALVAEDQKLVGAIGIIDPLRSTAKGLVVALKRSGVRHTVMLTGDHPATAQEVADAVGVDEVQADLVPEQKVEAIRRLQDDGRVVAMIGDGINDAPSLATADVSIAMGASGTQAAIESADIALMEDRLDKIPVAIALSRKILRGAHLRFRGGEKNVKVPIHPCQS